jgi:DNA mismatch endonuclease (patch repair protein)
MVLVSFFGRATGYFWTFEMVDVMDAGKRSALMSRIRGKNTTPELQVRRALWNAGFRYRLHSAALKGKPDIILKKWNAVVFVHGCFWHYHADCRLSKLPGTRPDFWAAKLIGNRERDQAAVESLRAKGWRVAIVWECALREDAGRSGRKLVRWLRGNRARLDVSALGAGPAKKEAAA